MATALPIDATAKPRRARSFYARVAALGFVLIAFAGFVGLISSLATGDTGENFVFSLVFVVVGLLVAAAAWTARGWALILAALLSLALLGLLGPFSLFALGHPESATEFVPIVLLLAGAALGLIGSIVAMVQIRRRAVRTNATGTERLAIAALLAVLALASLLSIAVTATSRTTVSAEAKTGAASVQIKNFSFSPSTVQAKAGETVRLVLRNDDASLHTFTLPAAAVDVAIPPGSERIVEFKAPAAGTYQYYCIPHSQDSGGTHEGMVGTLNVQ